MEPTFEEKMACGCVVRAQGGPTRPREQCDVRVVVDVKSRDGVVVIMDAPPGYRSVGSIECGEDVAGCRCEDKVAMEGVLQWNTNKSGVPIDDADV